MRDSDGEEAGARGGMTSSCSLRSTKGAVTTKTPVATAIPLNFHAVAPSFVTKECRSVNREFFTDVGTSFRLIYKISSADQRKSNIFSERSLETPIVDSQLRTIKPFLLAPRGERFDRWQRMAWPLPRFTRPDEAGIGTNHDNNGDIM